MDIIDILSLLSIKAAIFMGKDKKETPKKDISFYLLRQAAGTTLS